MRSTDMEYLVYPCLVSHAIGFNYKGKADRSALEWSARDP